MNMNEHKFNIPGDYCWREHILCEHNMIDAHRPSGCGFVCSQHTFDQCIEGSEYSFPPSEMKERRREI